MKNLENKVVVITGAGSGIGRALAIALAKEKCLLALTDYNPDSLQETVKILGNAQVIQSVFDVSDLKAFTAFRDLVLEKYKEVDIVINNAGVALGKQNIIQTSFEEIEWIMKINLWGVIYGSKLFLPHLIKQKESCLMNVSSVFGLMGIADQTPYCTTKFAVRGFTESVRMEMKEENITISSIHPGGIKTNIARDSKGWSHVNNKEELIELMEKESFKHTPEKAAAVIISGIKKKKEKILIGYEAYLIDYLTRLSPVGYTNVVYRQIKKKTEKLKQK